MVEVDWKFFEKKFEIQIPEVDINLSISHEKEYAVAYVIIQANNKTYQMEDILMRKCLGHILSGSLIEGLAMRLDARISRRYKNRKICFNRW